MHTDTLQFIGHEEGRVRWAYHNYSNVPIGYKDTIAYKFEYDFFERDHLGNTRTVLTQQRDTSNYIVTMEAAYRSTELQLFGNVAATSTAWTSMPNYTNILSGTRYLYTNPNDSVSKVDSTSAGGQKVGPNLLLKVMSGDTVNFTVQCYYVSPGGGSTNNSSFSDVLNSLSNGLVNLTGGAHGNLLNLTGSGSTVYNGLSSFLSGDDTAHTGYPKAYLNWIFLDDQFNYDSSLSGSVLAASSNNPPGSMNPVAPGGPITLNKSGYLYIWVSNETTGWDVYFDNLSIQYKQGPLLEENHYYPFGLTMAGISDKAIKTNYAENKYRYNGEELQHQEFSDGSGLEEYDYGARLQDPQLGVWHCIDPLAENTANMSPYCYGNNNPIGSIDLGGLITVAPPHNYVGPPTSYNEIDYTPWGNPYLSSTLFDNFNNLITGGLSEDMDMDDGDADYSAFWINCINALLSGGPGSSWRNNPDGTNSYNFANGGNQSDNQVTLYGVYTDQSGCTINYQPLAVVNGTNYNGAIYTPFQANPNEAPVTVNVNDYEDANTADAFLINLNAGFAALGGIGGDLTIAILNKGPQTGIYAYLSFDCSFGADASVSLTEGPVSFNQNNNAGAQLTPETFSGKSESVSWGALLYSGAYAWANTSGTWGGFSFSSGGNLLYSVVLSGAGVSATAIGARWNFSNTGQPIGLFEFEFDLPH
jgi:RHS repeat-associated protein